MNVSELAKELNGCQYPFRPTKELVEKARINGLVIVYGMSDDLMEFTGSIIDEIGVYDGGVAHVFKTGVLARREDLDTDEDIELWLKNKSESKEIKAKWDEEEGYTWTYETDIPHSVFDILEDDDKYCRALVFSVDNL